MTSRRVLSLIHQQDARTGIFADVVRRLGYELEEASLALGRPTARPAQDYAATIVMGGGMNVDEVDEHPWIDDEEELIAGLVERERPVLGVCLGSQLLAEAAGARVGPLDDGPEIGWHEVGLDPAAAGDPVVGAMPERFLAFQWHSYGSEPPRGATALARSDRGLQAYRLDGAPAWGVQFHAEVTPDTLAGWLGSYARDQDARDAGVDPQRLAAQNRREVGRWNELGRRLCRAFIEAALR
jgi:GMP synthase-like glutamine amidotransferase